MGNKDKKGDNGPSSFVTLIKAGVATFGGFAALIVAFGYIALQCYLSRMKLYGLASFPLQFFKEATVMFLRNTLDFYSQRPLLIILPVLIGGLPIIFKKTKILKKHRKISCIMCLIIVPIIVFLTFTLGIFKQECVREIFFFALSVPVLISLFLYLALNFDKFDLKRPSSNAYCLFLILFLLLFLVLPIGYGSNFFDIPGFVASAPECSPPLKAFGEMGGTYRLLYLMGHTSDREIFFDVTLSPAKIILVDKKLIKSITVNYDLVQVNGLKVLLSINKERKTLFEELVGLQKEILGKSDEVKQDDVQDWLNQKPVKLETKQGEEK